MTAETILFALLRAAVCDVAIDANVKDACTPQIMGMVYDLAVQHDLAHLIGWAVEKADLTESEELLNCKKKRMQVIYRYVRLDHEYKSICQTLEAARIPFIPLKGSVLRDYYPEPWMRTSCDIDVLVHEEMLDRATSVLEEKLGYVYEKKTSHDVSLYAPGGEHVELHYSTIESHVSESASRILSGIWEDARSSSPGRYQMFISDELFYYYHVAHMAKHFINGGCGIRTFMDVWILNHRVDHDRKKRETLLSEGGLLTFAQAAEKLAEIWFSNLEMDPFSNLLAGYILDGGTYGALKNRVSVSQVKKGGKVQYAWSRVFLPYDVIKYHYPVLQERKDLLPLYQVVRWFKLLFKGGARRSLRELQVNANVSQEEIMTSKKLLKHLELE